MILKSIIMSTTIPGRLQDVSYWTEPEEDSPSGYYANFSFYMYKENSQILQQQLNDGAMKNDYTYNNRNWITYMQNTSDIIQYANEYFKNGNVKFQGLSGDYHNNFSNTSSLSLNYSYDKSNRLLNHRQSLLL